MLAVSCGLLAMVGHMWPIFLGFKGGKGVATVGGIVFAMNWMAALLAMGVWVLVFLPFRYVSLGSIVAAAALPVAHHFTGDRLRRRWEAPWIITIFLSVAAALVVWRHRSNIGRLLKGTETRFARKPR
jgi:glycerol-3-phosphate acyltransferase PlsY